MEKYILLIICFSNLLYVQYNPDSPKSEKKNNDQLIKYPNLDMSAGYSKGGKDVVCPGGRTTAELDRWIFGADPAFAGPVMNQP
jgi:hypothetical protein